MRWWTGWKPRYKEDHYSLWRGLLRHLVKESTFKSVFNIVPVNLYINPNVNIQTLLTRKHLPNKDHMLKSLKIPQPPAPGWACWHTGPLNKLRRPGLVKHRKVLLLKSYFTHLWLKGLLPSLDQDFLQFASKVHRYYNSRYASRQNPLNISKARTNSFLENKQYLTQRLFSGTISPLILKISIHSAFLKNWNFIYCLKNLLITYFDFLHSIIPCTHLYY